MAYFFTASVYLTRQRLATTGQVRVISYGTKNLSHLTKRGDSEQVRWHQEAKQRSVVGRTERGDDQAHRIHRATPTIVQEGRLGGPSHGRNGTARGCPCAVAHGKYGKRPPSPAPICCRIRRYRLLPSNNDTPSGSGSKASRSPIYAREALSSSPCGRSPSLPVGPSLKPLA